MFETGSTSCNPSNSVQVPAAHTLAQRARKAWASMGVEGRSLAEVAPEADFCGMPRLTVRMVARLQGFPDDWQFYGRKTTAYRQVGNAFPPPVAKAVANNLRIVLSVQKNFPVRQVA